MFLLNIIIHSQLALGTSLDSHSKFVEILFENIDSNTALETKEKLQIGTNSKEDMAHSKGKLQLRAVSVNSHWSLVPHPGLLHI